MEKEIKEILKDYMSERQIELALPRLVNFIYSKNKLVKCSNCDEMVEMISSGEFCPCCFC